jgi:hypothetical protein
VPVERLGRSERRSRADKWVRHAPTHRDRPHVVAGGSYSRQADRTCSPRWPWQTGLDGIRIGASRKQGHHNDFDVEQKRPIIYVVQIALDAPPHLLDRISFSAMAVHLGPAGDARLDLMAA